VISEPPARRTAFAFIYLTVLLETLAFGITIPVLPYLVAHFTGGGLGRAAVWSASASALFMSMQFVGAPLIGTLSDRVGRRPVMLLSNLSLGLDFLVMALAPGLWLLLISRVICGLCAAGYPTSGAYIADTTPKQGRAAAFGLLGAAAGAGLVIGPALGGFLGTVSLRLPFWVAAGLALANFGYGLLVLPESLPRERRSPRFNWRHANPLGALLLLCRYPPVLGIAMVPFLMSLAQSSLTSTSVLYADWRFGWGPGIVGCAWGFAGACMILVQTVLVQKVMRVLGEHRTILAGLFLGGIGYLLFGLAPFATLFVAGVPFLCLSGLALPPAQAMMSNRVDPQEQGRLQGALSSLSCLAGVVGPPLFARVFAVFTAQNAPVPQLSGAAFLLAALLLGVASIPVIKGVGNRSVAKYSRPA
jgi:DHA1 family tetracycline resistance protein-like MFS transporter